MSKKSLFGGFFSGSKKNLVADPPPPSSPEPLKPKAAKITAKPRARPGDPPPPSAVKTATQPAARSDGAASGPEGGRSASPGLLFPGAPSFTPRSLGGSTGGDGPSPSLSADRGRSAAAAGSGTGPRAAKPAPMVHTGSARVTGRAEGPSQADSSRARALDSMRPPGIQTGPGAGPAKPAETIPAAAPVSFQPKSAVSRPKAIVDRRPPEAAPVTSFKSSLMQTMMAAAAEQPLPHSSLQDIVNYSPPRGEPRKDVETTKIQDLEIMISDDPSDVSSLSNGSAEYHQGKVIRAASPMYSTGVDITSAGADNDTRNQSSASGGGRPRGQGIGGRLNNIGPLKRTGSEDMTSGSRSPGTPVSDPVRREPEAAPRSPLKPGPAPDQRQRNAPTPPPASPAVTDTADKTRASDAAVRSPLTPARPSPMDDCTSFLANINKMMAGEDTAPAAAPAAGPRIPPTAVSPVKAEGSFLAAVTVARPAKEIKEEEVETAPVPEAASREGERAVEVPPQATDTLDAEQTPPPMEATEAAVAAPEEGDATSLRSIEDQQPHKRNMSLNTTTDTLSYNVSMDCDDDGDDSARASDREGPSSSEGAGQVRSRARKGSGDESLEEVWPWLKEAMIPKADSQSMFARSSSRGDVSVSTPSPHLSSGVNSFSPRHDLTTISVFSASPRGASISFTGKSGHFNFSEASIASAQKALEGSDADEDPPEAAIGQPESREEFDRDIDEPLSAVPSAELVDNEGGAGAPSLNAGSADAEGPAMLVKDEASADVTVSAAIEKEPALNPAIEGGPDTSSCLPLSSQTEEPVDVAPPGSTPVKSMHAVSAAISKTDDIFANLLAMIDGKHCGDATTAAQRHVENEKAADVVLPAIDSEAIVIINENKAELDVPHYQEVTSSYDRAMKPTSSEIDAAFRRAMSGVSGCTAEHERMMKSIDSLSAVLEDKQPGPDVNELLAPNWNLQLHLRKTLGPEELTAAVTLQQSERIAESARSFVSGADGRSRSRWDNTGAADPIEDREAVTGIVVPLPIEDYCRPFSQSLANRLEDDDIDRLVFTSSNDPVHLAARVNGAAHERFMKESGEAKLKESVDFVRHALTSSLDLLQSAVPGDLPARDHVIDMSEEMRSSYCEGYPVMDTSMHAEDLGISDDFNLQVHASPTRSIDEIADIITRAVMSAAPRIAEEDDFYYEEEPESYRSVRDRELRFDGREYKFNNLVQFTVSEADASRDKSKALFDMCDSDIDQLFNLGRSVAESGTHETYLNTLLKSSHRSARSTRPAEEPPHANQMSRAARNIDAELDLSPFVDISVDVRPKVKHGKYVVGVTSAPLSTDRTAGRSVLQPAHRDRSGGESGGRGRGMKSPARRLSRSPHDSRHDLMDDLSQHSVNTTRSRRGTKSTSARTNGFLEGDEPRRWHRAVEYSRPGSPGRLSSDRHNTHDDLLSPMRRSRSRSPSPSYMSPYYYAGHVMSTSSHRRK